MRRAAPKAVPHCACLPDARQSDACLSDARPLDARQSDGDRLASGALYIAGSASAHS